MAKSERTTVVISRRPPEPEPLTRERLEAMTVAELRQLTDATGRKADMVDAILEAANGSS